MKSWTVPPDLEVKVWVKLKLLRALPAMPYAAVWARNTLRAGRGEIHRQSFG